MIPFTKEMRRDMIASFRSAIKDKKELRIAAMKEFNSEPDLPKAERNLPYKLRPISANAHILALIIKNKPYEKMLESYSHPADFWKQMYELYGITQEYQRKTDLSRVLERLDGVKAYPSTRETEFYSLVKLFNNQVFDADVASVLSEAVEDFMVILITKE